MAAHGVSESSLDFLLFLDILIAIESINKLEGLERRRTVTRQRYKACICAMIVSILRKLIITSFLRIVIIAIVQILALASAVTEIYSDICMVK